eukprot:366048-Chlamydomonas_euryale.AAC.9
MSVLETSWSENVSAGDWLVRECQCWRLAGQRMSMLETSWSENVRAGDSHHECQCWRLAGQRMSELETNPPGFGIEALTQAVTNARLFQTRVPQSGNLSLQQGGPSRTGDLKRLRPGHGPRLASPPTWKIPLSV